MSALLSLRGVRKRYGDVAVVDGVNLDVLAGERVGLVGESGSGKSTLARLALRLHDVDDGTVNFDNVDVTRVSGSTLQPLRKRAQLVFQDAASALNPLMTVSELVAEGLVIHGLAHTDGERTSRVNALLDEVGLDASVRGRRPRELSGGQKQRVGIARALAVDPELLVCDEPVSALDVSVQAQVVNLLAALSARRGLALLFIAHDLHVVRHMCTRVLVMYRGRVVEEGPVDAVFGAPRHPYTQALVAAAPVVDAAALAARRSGAASRPLAVFNVDDKGGQEGCAFRPRCPRQTAACAVAPALGESDAVGRGAACHHPQHAA